MSALVRPRRVVVDVLARAEYPLSGGHPVLFLFSRQRERAPIARPADPPDRPTRAHMLSIGSFASKVFGSSNDRKIKGMRPRVAEINALEPEIAKLSDADLRARTEDFRRQIAAGMDVDALLVPAFATVREGGQACARPAAFRRPDDGRDGAARGQDRRNEDRRGQNAGRHARRLSQRARRQGRSRRHRQRLPRQPRRGMDGPGLQVPRPDRRLHRARPRRRRAAPGLRLRRDLRHQQRARLRLPARQHEDEPRRDGAARAPFRDRRRGRLRS